MGNFIDAVIVFLETNGFEKGCVIERSVGPLIKFFAECSELDLKVNIKDFKAKGFLRVEVISKRALRYACALYNITYGGSSEPALVDEPKTFLQDFLAIGEFRHGGLLESVAN